MKGKLFYALVVHNGGLYCLAFTSDQSISENLERHERVSARIIHMAAMQSEVWDAYYYILRDYESVGDRLPRNIREVEYFYYSAVDAQCIREEN